MWRGLITAGAAVAALALGMWMGASGPGEGPIPALGPAPAFAGDIEAIGDGETFVSTDGGNAYLWRRNGDRIELLGQCSRIMDDSEAQAPFVWLPGVERRS